MILNKTAVWWINFIAVLALTQPLDGCNKIAQKTPSQCKDISIQNKLLDLSSLKIMTNPQLNSNIINITTLEKFPNRITNCRAIIDYRYSIIPTKNYRLAYDFTINDDGEITKLVPQNNLKNIDYKTWLTQLPQMINQQNSCGGTLSTLQIQNKNQLQQRLYLNTRILNFPDQNNINKITITQTINFTNQDIFIINIQNLKLNLNTNYLLSIQSESQFYLSNKFNYQNIGINQDQSQINFLGSRKYQFSESNDYSIYQYKNNQLKLIQNAHPITYYQQKFSTLTPTQILTQIKADGCLNGDQFYLSDICTNNITTYCFKFNSMNQPQKNKAYWLLQSMCLNHYEYSN